VHDYTFFVTSTINSPHGKFSVDERFNQTVDGLASIRRKVPNCQILLFDNSIEPLNQNQTATLKSMVEVYKQYDHNLFSRFVNINNFNKGLGELLMMEQALPIIKNSMMPAKRIFKMSGRYKLTDNFNIANYETDYLKGKYSFLQTVWAFSNDNFQNNNYLTFNETRLWSFCSSLFLEVEQSIQTIFNYMLNKQHNIEVAINHCLASDKVVVLPKLDIEGYFFSGEFRQE